MRIIFTKACFFNRHKRVVGNITTVIDPKKLDYLLRKGYAKEYNGIYPPNEKTKINLKDLK